MRADRRDGSCKACRVSRYVNLQRCFFDSFTHAFLGLDASRYRSTAGGDEQDGGGGAAPTFMALDSQMSDAERFKDAIPFRVRCKHCQAMGMWGPLWEDVNLCFHSQTDRLIPFFRRLYFISLVCSALLASSRSQRPVCITNLRHRFESVSGDTMKDGLSVTILFVLSARGWLEWNQGGNV